MEDQQLISDKEKNGGHQKEEPPPLALKICVLYGCAMTYSARTVIPLVVQDMAHDLGWSSVLVGYVLSFFFWGYAVTQVIGGRWADRIGGAKVIVATSMMGAISLILLPQLVVLWAPSAVLLRFFLGLVQGPHYPSMSSLSYQLVEPTYRARFLSIAFMGSPLGTIMVGMFGSIMLEMVGWQNTVIVIGCFYGCGAVWMHQLTKHHEVGQSAKVDSDVGVPWRALLTSRPVWLCIIVHTSHTVCWFLFISWLPSYFKQVHPTAEGWMVNTLPYLMAASGTASSTPLAEALLHRWQFSVTATRKTVELISQLSVAATLFLLPLTSSVWTATLLIGVCAASLSLHANGGLQLPQDLCPQHTGSMFGVMNTGGALGGFFANLAAGYLINASGGDYSPVFHMAGALAAAGALTFAAFGSAEPLKL